MVNPSCTSSEIRFPNFHKMLPGISFYHSFKPTTFMKNLAAKFKSYLPKITESFFAENLNASVEFVKRKKIILQELQYCHNKGNLVGVYSDVLGEGMFLLGVEDVIQLQDEELIVFYPDDMSGLPLKRRTIFLKEIKKIVPFNNLYINPRNTFLYVDQSAA
jgi:hypothetical protein